MPEKDELGAIALETLRGRVTKILPAQIRSCVEQLEEAQLWWRPNEQSNSVGNLVLHVSGSMRHYLCRAVGGFEYQRDRAAEFAERGPVPKEKLLSIFDETINQAALTFDSLTPARLMAPSTEPNYYRVVFEDLFGVAIHLATHAGQIVYVTKMLKEGSLDELWIKTHRTLGGWRT